jgi:hypothetical protein
MQQEMEQTGNLNWRFAATSQTAPSKISCWKGTGTGFACDEAVNWGFRHG